MRCQKCSEGYYISLETGEEYCPCCGNYYINPVLLQRPDDLPNYNPIPKKGWSEDYRNDLPF